MGRGESLLEENESALGVNAFISICERGCLKFTHSVAGRDYARFLLSDFQMERVGIDAVQTLVTTNKGR